jgi:hypothetical protein
MDMPKVAFVIEIFKRAISKGFKADYVLMESWFTYETFIPS